MTNKQNTVDSILMKLKKDIIQTTYMPGEILSENTIAESFGVSRTPVREALKRLQQDGWVSFIPNIGVQVSNISVKDIKEYFEVRRALEQLAIQLTIKNMSSNQYLLVELKEISEQIKIPKADWNEIVALDAKFHDIVWRMSGNEKLEKYLSNIQEQEQRWWYYMETCKVHIKFFKTGEEFNIYDNITHALETCNEELAVKYILEHIDYYIEQLKLNMYI